MNGPPTFNLSINPSAIVPEPGVFPKRRILKILETCVRPLGTFRGVPVVWATDKRDFLGNNPDQESAWIVASMSSNLAIGCEELRTQLNSQTDNREALLVAQRQCTITLRAFSTDADVEAFDLLTRVRFYINTAPVRAFMVPTIALVDYMPIQVYTDKMSEGRSLLAAMMDLRLAYVEAADPMEQGEQGFVENASGEGELCQ